MPRLALAALILLCCTSGSLQTWAQKGSLSANSGILDKAKAKTKLLERYRAKLEVKDDAEWNIIQQRIEAIWQAQRDLQLALQVGQHKSRSFGSKAASSKTPAASRDDILRTSGEESETEVRALQKLVESHAPAQEIKPRLARVRELLRVRQDKLATAREDLRMVLSSRQEAIAILSGLLR